MKNPCEELAEKQYNNFGFFDPDHGCNFIKQDGSVCGKTPTRDNLKYRACFSHFDLSPYRFSRHYVKEIK